MNGVVHEGRYQWPSDAIIAAMRKFEAKCRQEVRDRGGWAEWTAVEFTDLAIHLERLT